MTTGRRLDMTGAIKVARRLRGIEEGMQGMADLFTERLIALGKDQDELMSIAAIAKCNCMVRYHGGPQMPAIRRDVSDRIGRGKGNHPRIHAYPVKAQRS